MARAKNRKSSGVYRREGSPYWQFRHPLTKLRTSSGTTEREAAEALLAKLKLDLFNGQLGKKPSITLDSLFARYMIEHAQHLKSSRMVERYCANLLRHLGNKPIETLTASDLSIYKAQRRGDNPDISNATINRELETIRTCIFLARKWGYNYPEIDFKVVMLREPEARVVYLNPEQVQALLDNCNDLIRDPVEFAMYTGLRADNIFSLTWEQVNLFNKEITVKLKSNIPGGKTLRLPISSKMHEILVRNNPSTGLVFKNKVGKKISRYNAYFDKARKKAGLDIRFHDLRHHAATMLRMNGTPIEIVQQILGHTNISTTMKYAHTHESEVSKALNQLAQNSHTRRVA